jgi:hypothetical protein
MTNEEISPDHEIEKNILKNQNVNKEKENDDFTYEFTRSADTILRGLLGGLTTHSIKTEQQGEDTIVITGERNDGTTAKIIITKGERYEPDSRRISPEKNRENDLAREFGMAILNLELKVAIAKDKGEEKMPVAHFSTSKYGENNARAELYNIIKDSGCGNFNYAWRQGIITEQDVKKYMDGNLKRCFDYCVDAGYTVKIEYWQDGGGRDEGFEVVIVL